MDSAVVVLIITLAMPNGDHSVSVKPMTSAASCQAAAEIEVTDPYVAAVECSELEDGKLELTFRKGQHRKIPEAVVERSTG
jgi:hypothetical protein